MSDHVMDQIEQGAMVPIQKQDTKPSAVYMAARSIFAEFSVGNNKTTQTIITLAMQGLTPEEYDEAEKLALKMAGDADTSSGWQAKESAKGREKYGPLKSTCATMASMRRQVFGAARLDMSCIVSIGPNGTVFMDALPVFSRAVDMARKYLKDKKLDWTGRPTEDARRDKATKGVQAEYVKARASAEKDNPMKQGENYGQWQERIDTIIEKTVEENRLNAITEQARGLIKEKGNTYALELAEELLRLLAPTEDAPM